MTNVVVSIFRQKKNHLNASLNLATHVCYAKFYFYENVTQSYYKNTQQYYRFAVMIDYVPCVKWIAQCVVLSNSVNGNCVLFRFYNNGCS